MANLRKKDIESLRLFTAEFLRDRQFNLNEIQSRIIVDSLLLKTYQYAKSNRIPLPRRVQHAIASGIRPRITSNSGRKYNNPGNTSEIEEVTTLLDNLNTSEDQIRTYKLSNTTIEIQGSSSSRPNNVLKETSSMKNHRRKNFIAKRLNTHREIGLNKRRDQSTSDQSYKPGGNLFGWRNPVKDVSKGKRVIKVRSQYTSGAKIGAACKNLHLRRCVDDLQKTLDELKLNMDN